MRTILNLSKPALLHHRVLVCRFGKPPVEIPMSVTALVRQSIRRVAFWAVLCLCLPAVAQNGGRTGSETDLLRREEIQQELGLSET